MFSKQFLIFKDQENLVKSSSYFEAGCCILKYIADIINAVYSQKVITSHDRATSPPWEGLL